MKKILILILITALMILSCKEVPTDVNTSPIIITQATQVIITMVKIMIIYLL